MCVCVCDPLISFCLSAVENRMGSFAVIPEETVSLSVVSNFQLSSPVRSLVLGVQEDIDSFQTSNVRL